MMSGSSKSRSHDRCDGDQWVAPHRRAPAADATGPVEEAIQAGCGTLFALRASLASVEALPGEHGHAETALRSAIDLIVLVISDLRDSISVGSRSPLSLGFVSTPRSAHRPK